MLNKVEVAQAATNSLGRDSEVGQLLAKARNLSMVVGAHHYAVGGAGVRKHVGPCRGRGLELW